ncbi:hypothetical protein BU23DRAFT_601379 [Bimuria novae-zelandiae CBS 107.79]|uniref:Uncharacterized protein n=1 Tax=Bimuria novae-zelandiae CBS 107.79 TaxID=1447943 RepID=A0A6A5UZA0_9PLEO|nr:hypothetical protein BU23DRAFT_601379 [Bimuria novae-zelandiae CBS 107.79]
MCIPFQLPASSFHSNVNMPAVTSPQNKMSSEGPMLEYLGTDWHRSSHELACNLYREYDAGVKLWTKENLRDIESQLAHSREREYFTVHLIDGTTAQIRNPMFGEALPRRRQLVLRYREYWKLVTLCDCPEELYRVSYFIDWENASVTRSRRRGEITDAAA